ncbi:MAG: alanine racemase [Kiritimatiellia bacterium]
MKASIRNTWVELDFNILESNLRAIKSALTPGTEIMLVVKSEAYGHGLADVTRCALSEGVSWFVTAHLFEAEAVRAVAPDSRILVMGVMDPGEVEKCLDQRVTPVIVSEAHAMALAGAAAAGGKTLNCHAKVDTGMGRLGFPWNQAVSSLRKLAAENNLHMEGLCTHFASSDSPDREFADTQAERFRKVCTECAESGLSFSIKHISNSGGIVREAGWDMDGVRPGILAYGYAPAGHVSVGNASRKISTRPLLQWKSRIVQSRDLPEGFPVSYGSTYMTPRPSRIAVVDAGYADGYPRALSNKAYVLAGGRRCPVVGRVTMNLFMIDTGMDHNVRQGDEVVLMGASGNEEVWADEIADWCDTIPYEILTGIRAPRITVAGAEKLPD